MHVRQRDIVQPLIDYSDCGDGQGDLTTGMSLKQRCEVWRELCVSFEGVNNGRAVDQQQRAGRNTRRV